MRSVGFEFLKVLENFADNVQIFVCYPCFLYRGEGSEKIFKL